MTPKRFKQCLWLLGFLIVANIFYHYYLNWGLITVKVHDAPLGKVIRSIEWQGWVKIYTNLDLTSKVTMYVDHVPLAEAMETLAVNVDVPRPADRPELALYLEVRDLAARSPMTRFVDLGSREGLVRKRNCYEINSIKRQSTQQKLRVAIFSLLKCTGTFRPARQSARLLYWSIARSWGRNWSPSSSRVTRTYSRGWSRDAFQSLRLCSGYGGKRRFPPARSLRHPGET